MARTTGTFDFSANFEVNKSAPLDARLTVEDKSELTGLPFPYIGMVVAVTSDSTATNNGVYVLDDADGTTLSNWKLVGNNSGSFSGSFQGDGSGLTGVTAEWDGSHVGDASITGSLIISGANASVDFTNAEAGVSGSFSGSFEGDGSGLTGVAPVAGDGIFVTGTTVSVDSASLATDMAGDFITATNGTLNLADSVGTIGTTQFTGSFSGSLDGSINVVDTNATASYQLVFREGTAGGFSALYADQDNAKLRYNPGTNTLENTTLIGDVTGDLTGTATSASHVASAYDTVGISNATISLTDMGGNTDQITVNNVVNSDSASLATTASYVSAGNIDGTVASASNATNINVASDGGNVDHFVIFTDSATGNNRPKSDAGLKYNPSTNILTTTVTNANNASAATTAANVALTTSDTDQAFNLIFTEAGDESGAMLVDSDYQITYNPNTDKLSLGGDLNVGGTATVTGDLIVNGTTTTISTENLDVEDSFILLSSGSSAGGDSGIIFGGNRGTAGEGTALFWDASYNSNQGRLGVTKEITSTTSSPISNENLGYYIAGVVVGTESQASAVNAAHNGNIRIYSGEIYIYVE